jgi:hypothetical protein
LSGITPELISEETVNCHGHLWKTFRLREGSIIVTWTVGINGKPLHYTVYACDLTPEIPQRGNAAKRPVTVA